MVNLDNSLVDTISVLRSFKTVTACFAQSKYQKNLSLLRENKTKKGVRPIKSKSRSNAGSGSRPDRNLRKTSVHRVKVKFFFIRLSRVFSLREAQLTDKQTQLTCYLDK